MAILLHLALLALLHQRQGLLLDGEALKYIGCAEDVLQGDTSDLFGNYLKYGSYVLFLLPFAAIGHVSWAVAAQVLLGLVSAFALRRMIRRLTGSEPLALIGSALFLLYPLIQTWTLALYTEHFFLCLGILFLERWTRGDLRGPLTGLILLALLFARPVGIFLAGPLIIHSLTERLQGWQQRLARAGGCVLLILAAFTLIPIPEAQWEPIAGGQVIAGVGGEVIHANPTANRTVAAAHAQFVNGHGTAAWLKLTAARATSFLWPTRAYYSTKHNGLIMATLGLLYPLAVFGLWRERREPIAAACAASLLTYIAAISLTHDEWSGRFLVPLLPWLILWAMVGMRGGR